MGLFAMIVAVPDPPSANEGTPEQPQGQVPPPRCKAMLLCDQVIVEAETGRASVINTLDRFRMNAYPGQLRPFTAFLQLVDGIGRYDIVIEIQDLQQDAIIGRGAGIGLEFPERLGRINVIIPIPPLMLQHAGAYDVVVIANGQEIDRQQFVTV